AVLGNATERIEARAEARLEPQRLELGRASGAAADEHLDALARADQQRLRRPHVAQRVPVLGEQLEGRSREHDLELALAGRVPDPPPLELPRLDVERRVERPVDEVLLRSRIGRRLDLSGLGAGDRERLAARWHELAAVDDDQPLRDLRELVVEA